MMGKRPAVATSTNKHHDIPFTFTRLLHQWIIVFFASQSYYLTNNNTKRKRIVRTTKTAPPVEIENEKEKKVSLKHPSEPEVSLYEKTRFVLWSIRLVLRQAWSDFVERRWFSGTLVSDAWSHYYYIPMSRRDPHIVTGGPYNRIQTRLLPSHVTRRYEEKYDFSSVEPVPLINCACNNYAGFADLEYGTESVIARALETIPFVPAPRTLDETVREECARFMSCDICVTVPSGYGTNVVAFASIAAAAKRQGRKCVILCDADCHNSMFTGAFYCKEANVHRFGHNDLTDLEFKLRMYREQAPDASICVAVEGIYSLEGAISPLPAILALKRVYKFTLLVDEAHSFLAMGSSGRGSPNHWQDLGYECRFEEIDIMTFTFSKAVGCTGGFVLANGKIGEELRREDEKLRTRGAESLSVVGLLRLLSLIRKPALVAHRMRLLSEKADYVAAELRRAGCCVLASPGSAVICFPVGTVSQVSMFHGVAVKMGVAVAGAGPPATPVWGCRIRLCVFATHTWPEIHQILRVIVASSIKLNVRGVKATTFDDKLLEKSDPVIPDAVRLESARVDSELLSFVDVLSAENGKGSVTGTIANSKFDAEVRAAGVEGLKRYGTGTTSARWFYGSFDIFIQLERRLASLYPSLVAATGPCHAITCGDAEIAIASTLTALMEKNVSRNGPLHRVLVASTAPSRSIAGATIRRPTKNVALTFFNSIPDLLQKLESFRNGPRYYLTLYLETVDTANKGLELDLLSLISEATPNLKPKITGLTLLLDDRYGMGKLGPRNLGYMDLLESRHGKSVLKSALEPLALSKKNTRVLVAGSWYHAFGHQGGYLVGDAGSVECLSWDSRAFVFSTPPMPLQACMSDRMLCLLSGADSFNGVRR